MPIRFSWFSIKYIRMHVGFYITQPFPHTFNWYIFYIRHYTVYMSIYVICKYISFFHFFCSKNITRACRGLDWLCEINNRFKGTKNWMLEYSFGLFWINFLIKLILLSKFNKFIESNRYSNNIYWVLHLATMLVKLNIKNALLSILVLMEIHQSR